MKVFESAITVFVLQEYVLYLKHIHFLISGLTFRALVLPMCNINPVVVRIYVTYSLLCVRFTYLFLHLYLDCVPIYQKSMFRSQMVNVISPRFLTETKIRSLVVDTG